MNVTSCLVRVCILHFGMYSLASPSFVFTALRGMQTQSRDENSVRLSNGWIVTKRRKICPLQCHLVGGGDPFYLKFWVKGTALERNCRFSIYFR